MAHETVDMVVDLLDDLGIPPRPAPGDPGARWRPGCPAASPRPRCPTGRFSRTLASTSFPSPASTDTLASSPSSPAAGPSRGCSATSSPARSTSRSARGWRRRAPRGWRSIVLDWFKEWIGYPPGAAGVLVSGGSAANLTALACAREAMLGPMRDDLVIYVCDQAHSSVARAARGSRLQADPAAGAAQRRGFPPAPRCAPRGDRRRRARRPCSPFAVCASARLDQHRRRRSAAGACLDLRAGALLAPRRRRLWGLRGADGAGAGACWRDRARPTRSPSIPISGSTSRSSAAACWCARAGLLRRRLPRLAPTTSRTPPRRRER